MAAADHRLVAATYLASAVALMGAVPERLPLWPTVLTQAASSFVNRVSPANVGGMALNARYLQKCGIEPARALLHGTAGQSRWVLLPEQLARLLTLLLPGRLDAYRPGGPGRPTPLALT